jgi:hypothetical protein
LDKGLLSRSLQIVPLRLKTLSNTVPELGTRTKKPENIGEYAVKISLFQRRVKEYEFAGWRVSD